MRTLIAKLYKLGSQKPKKSKILPCQLEERGHCLVPAEPGLASARPAYCQVGHQLQKKSDAQF